MRKARSLGRRLWRRLRLQPASGEVDLEQVIDPAFFPENELKLWQIHLRALLEHVERPHAGSVTLYRTRGEPLFCSFAEDFCWRRLAQGGVTVKRIPGSHESIFMEPNVQWLARELASDLAAAMTRGEPQTPSSL